MWRVPLCRTSEEESSSLVSSSVYLHQLLEGCRQGLHPVWQDHAETFPHVSFRIEFQTPRHFTMYYSVMIIMEDWQELIGHILPETRIWIVTLTWWKNCTRFPWKYLSVFSINILPGNESLWRHHERPQEPHPTEDAAWGHGDGQEPEGPPRQIRVGGGSVRKTSPVWIHGLGRNKVRVVYVNMSFTKYSLF